MPGLFGFGEGVRELLVMLKEVFLLVLLVVFRSAGALYVTIGSLVYSIFSVTICLIKAQISTNTSNFRDIFGKSSDAKQGSMGHSIHIF